MDNTHHDIRRDTMTRATWISISVNLFLSVAQLIIGFIGHSQALIADSVHTLSDLTADFLVLLVTRHSNKAADDDHPYGHTRYETLATSALALLLIAVAIGIALSAFNRILHPSGVTPSLLTLWVAAFTIAGKEGLYHYTVYMARKVKSRLLEASAWHHRSDAISSIIVLIGITGAILGWPILDPLAAIAVAVMIAQIGWKLGYHSMQELADAAIEPEKVNAIRDVIKNIDGVQELHMLRTRRMGHNALVDVHILVDARLSVSEGHQISETVEYTLRKQFEEINDVTVHIDPEDDQYTPNSCRELPLRSEILNELKARWKYIPQAGHIHDTILHYIDGKVNVEAILPLNVVDSVPAAMQLRDELRIAAAEYSIIRKIDVLYKPAD